MKTAIAISVIFIIVASAMLGCTNQQAEQSAVQNTQPQEQNRTEPEETSLPPPSTANLSFGRNASDVLNTDTKFFEKPQFNFSEVITTDGRLIVYYFYSPHCTACIALRPEIDRLESKYADVEWKEFDLTTQNGSWAYQDFAAALNLSQQERFVPQILVNGTIITDKFNINRTLEGILASFSAGQS